MITTLSVTEAHRRFGDLARIRNGVTHWLEVRTPEGVWRPRFCPWFNLVAYDLHDDCGGLA
jgi:hypothetical protein